MDICPPLPTATVRHVCDELALAQLLASGRSCNANRVAPMLCAGVVSTVCCASGAVCAAGVAVADALSVGRCCAGVYILVMYTYFILQYLLYIIIMLIAGNAANLQCAPPSRHASACPPREDSACHHVSAPAAPLYCTRTFTSHQFSRSRQ